MPLCVIKRLLERLFCWTTGKTQRQFSLVYGPFTSTLSRECRLEGGCPISSKNFSNEVSQSAHTLIPRPPYLGYFLVLGLLQRVFISAQIEYIRVCAMECVVLRLMQIFRFCSSFKQPQELDSPTRKVCPSISFSIPQMHLQSHSHLRFDPILDLDNTVSLPKVFPVKSINAPITIHPSMFNQSIIPYKICALQAVNDGAIITNKSRGQGCL